MPAKPITIGDRYFPRKGDAAAYFREMLYKYDLGDKVGTADAAFLSAAILRHPEAEAKIGAGIASFSVRSADFGTRCFWVNRVDDTSEKFSFDACIY